MPRIKSAPFFETHPVFRRAEYAAAVGREPGDRVVSAMLAHHVRAGNIRRVVRGVFVSVPAGFDSDAYLGDSILAASRLREDGVLGYHSALEVHGCAYSIGYQEVVISRGRPGLLRTPGFVCRFVPPPRRLPEDAPTDGIARFPRLGLDVRVTTLERTLVDVFERPELAGGWDELTESLGFVDDLDASALVRHASERGSAVVAGALGFWLEREREHLRFPPAAVEELRRQAPSAVRRVRGIGWRRTRLVGRWNLILPEELVEPTFEGIPLDCDA